VSQPKGGLPPIVYILLLLGLGAGGYYYYTNAPGGGGIASSVLSTTDSTNSPAAVSTTAPALALPKTIPVGSSVQLDGSTSLAKFNQRLGKAFLDRYPGVSYDWKANGSSKGIQALLTGQVDVAASSRPLTEEEKNNGLVAVPVKNDAIALLVSKENPFRGGLTAQQVRDIFTGKVTNWSQVGGPPLPLQVINRNPSSGTYKVFQTAALAGSDFGSGPNWTTMNQDVTTEILQELKTNGIGYASYSEIKEQKTIRFIPLDGNAPDSPNYPLPTVLYYVYSVSATYAAKAFVAFATSPEGKAIAALQ
jgi:phosphate transport system substrate-binding protein